MSNVDGLRLFLDRSDTPIRIRSLIEDSRETESIPLNSASGNWNISNATNLYDGNWHTIMFTWACNDTTSLPNMGNRGTSALSRGILIVDGLVVANESSWPGKSTPLEFIFNDSNSATFFGIGAKMSQVAASSIISNTQVDQTAAMIIKRLCIWDRPLPDTSTNLDISIGVIGPDSITGHPSLFDFLYWGKDAAEGVPGFEIMWDSLTGQWFRGSSANVIAYYKFDQTLQGSISAIDHAGKDFFTSSSGSQLSPSMGNPLRFWDSAITQSYYNIIDVPVPDQDNVYRVGSLQFEDENGIRRKVGTINYDLGTVVLDGQYPVNQTSVLSGLPFLQSIGVSGLSLNNSQSASSIYVDKINFTSQKFVERLILNIGSSGSEMNITENKTGIDKTTGEQLLKPSAGYISSIGFYNDYNELMGIAKLNHPIRKDVDHNVLAQTRIDFKNTYSGYSITA